MIVDHGKSCTVCLFEDSGPVKRFAMFGEQAAPNVVYTRMAETHALAKLDAVTHKATCIATMADPTTTGQPDNLSGSQ